MPADPYAIFLDTQVFEAASFNFKMTALASLEEQVQKGTVRLIITDITVREVKGRIEKTVIAQLEGITKFKRNARVLRSSSLPEASGPGPRRAEDRRRPPSAIRKVSAAGEGRGDRHVRAAGRAGFRAVFLVQAAVRGGR
jgi:hypothetical protein